MKALVFSDSHGRLEHLLEVIKQHKDCHAIFHLGDVEGDEQRLRNATPYPVYMVRGNCDYDTKIQETMVVEWGGKRIAMTHGHRYLTYGGMDSLRYFGQQEKGDIVMFGHTHVPFLEEMDGRVYLNPGSISKPRQERKIPTYTIITLESDGNISFEMCEFVK